MSMPQQIKAWQFPSNHGDVAKNLRLDSTVTVPKPSEPKQILVKVLTVSFKLPQLFLP